MKNMRLTAAGAELLGTTHADGTPRYWIGYYGLAYVGDRETDSLDMAAETGVLTQSGDNIYNIWQGDMLNGYAQDNPEDTAAATLFGLTLYDKSIRTNYRYVYDPGNPNVPNKPARNRLVAWKSISNGHGENTLERKGAAIYMGTDGTAASEIPLPAPLYYGGETATASIITNTPEQDTVPVSADYRYYVGTRDGGEYGWKESRATQDATTVGDTELLESISNFNKFHGTASSEGYGVSSVSSCHNMSKATKLFPISYYNVVNDNGKKVAETRYADNSPARKPLASAIKFSIDLSPVTADAGYTALNYEDGGIVDDQDSGDTGVYESKYISFRFNRIGIYAVPMTVHRYSTDSSTDECNLQKVQFEIDGDADPVLFAVADLNDVIISDNPSSEEGGVAKFSLEFILNLGNSDTDTAVERRTAVYYDLYENDATTWYKNQLLASASISEAVTDLSIEVNALKQQAIGGGKECCEQDVDLSRYAMKNHTHDYPKNLVDGADNAGTLRGIYTCKEGNGKDIPAVFGLYDGIGTNVERYCQLPAIPTWESGLATEIPASYLYCYGFCMSGAVHRTNCISRDQLVAIVKVHGVEWLMNYVVTSTGYLQNGGTGVTDLGGHVYIWTDPENYLSINVTTGEMTEGQINPGGTDSYQMVTILSAGSEPMFADGYSIGAYSTILGTNTAGSGANSLIQGKDVYSDSDYTVAVGSNGVKVTDSLYVTVSGTTMVKVKDCESSVIVGVNGNTPITFDGLDSTLILGTPGHYVTDMRNSLMIGDGIVPGYRVSSALSVGSDNVLPSDSKSLVIVGYGNKVDDFEVDGDIVHVDPKPFNNTLIVGNNNSLGCDTVAMSGVTVVGERNSAAILDLNNSSVFGDDVHLDGGTPRTYPGVGGTMEYATISNVHVFASGLTINLTSDEQYATHEFTDAIVNIGSRYDQSVLGIYDTPSDYGLSQSVGKPGAPMVYTGGIALCGKPGGNDDVDGNNFALVKLGHKSKSVSYIAEHPVSTWGDLLAPVSVVGTTTCPYGGMTLTVDGTQELDGTMHLVLSKVNRGNTTFAYEFATVTETGNFDLVQGKNYVIDRSDSSVDVTLSVSNMMDGDECIVFPRCPLYVSAIGNGSSRTTLLPIEDGKMCGFILRRVSYVAASSTVPVPKALITPLVFNGDS